MANPMSLTRYEATVPVGSPNRHWLGPLRRSHGTEIHIAAEWQALIDAMKAEPATGSENLRRPAGR
jgi:hypothetical protein